MSAIRVRKAVARCTLAGFSDSAMEVALACLRWYSSFSGFPAASMHLLVNPTSWRNTLANSKLTRSAYSLPRICLSLSMGLAEGLWNAEEWRR